MWCRDGLAALHPSQGGARNLAHFHVCELQQRQRREDAFEGSGGVTLHRLWLASSPSFSRLFLGQQLPDRAALLLVGLFLKELAIVADIRVLNVTVQGTTNAAESTKLPLGFCPSRPEKTRGTPARHEKISETALSRDRDTTVNTNPLVR